MPTSERYLSHLESLRRSYEAQRDLALHRLEECNAELAEDGVKVAQVDVSLAMRGLLHVNDHLWAAQREMVKGSTGGSTGRTVEA